MTLHNFFRLMLFRSAQEAVTANYIIAGTQEDMALFSSQKSRDEPV
jgi:hypothetical protein